MPIIDTSINKFIEAELLRENAEREATHEPSGKLSASMLFQPLRFQVLKTIGAPRKPMDSYTLGKFKRGRDVEDWYVGQIKLMGALKESQRPLEYRGVIGYADAIVDTSNFQAKKGEIPYEVKSVTNMKLRRIAQQGVDYHYKLQGCLYALAMGTVNYAIGIVSAEDYRPTTYIFDVYELKQEIDHIIDNYDRAMKAWNEERKLPAFAPNPKVPWTADIKYAMFEPEWVGSDEWAVKQLQALGIVKE